MTVNRRWLPEIDQFLIDNVEGVTNAELRDRINERFGTDFTKEAIYQRKHKLGVTSGIISITENSKKTRFQKGHIPANKGKKMSEETKAKIKHTLFPKGHKPWTTRPLYSMRVGKDGYLFIKHDENEKRWKPLQAWIYEQATGDKVNKGEVVIFLDRYKYNFTIENLIKVKRGELAILNHNYKMTDNAESNLSNILMAKISYQEKKNAEKYGMVDKFGRISL